MTIDQNDPPVTGNAPSARTDDEDWDNVVFDDTEVPLASAPFARKRPGKKKLLAGAAVIVLLAAGGYAYLSMQAEPAVTPQMLAAQMESQMVPPSQSLESVENIGVDQLMNDTAARDAGSGQMMPPTDEFGNPLSMPADGTGVMNDPNIDPFGPVLPDNGMPPVPGSELAGNAPGAMIPGVAVMNGPVDPAIDPFDPVMNDPNVDPAMIADVNVVQDGLIPADGAVAPAQMDMNVPVETVDGADQAVPPAWPDEGTMTDMPAGMAERVENTAPAPDSAADAAAVDAQLEAELIRSLMAGTAPSPNTAPDEANTNGDVSAEEALINNMGALEGTVSAPPVAALGSLEGIEADAYVRPNPQNFYIVQQESAPVQRNRQIMEARRALNEGRDQRALELFNALYEENPNNAGVLLGRGVALQRMGQYNEALTVYEQVLRDNPENLEALTNMLGILAMQNPAYSVSNLQRLHERYPSNVAIKTQLGLAYGDLGYIKEAVTFLHSAQNMEPRNPTIAYNLGVMYDRAGDTVNAASQYRRALTLERNGGYRGTIPVEAIQNRLGMFR